jgi:integrase
MRKRKRYQRGSVTKSSNGRYWIGKYREGGQHKTKSLGKPGEISKSKAQEAFETFMKELNAAGVSADCTLKEFVETVYLPFYRRKWKASTSMVNTDRVNAYIVAALGDAQLRALTRDGLQTFLDSKSKLSFSTVAHLRWDLRQIFKMAVAEGLVSRNPAELLFVPRQCQKPTVRTMTIDEVNLAIGALDLRERLIFKLAVFAGLRPGEILGLRHGRITEDTVDIQERIYRGQSDTPKTEKSKRLVPLLATIRQDLQDWRAACPAPAGADSWLFPSENVRTPLMKENIMYRHMRPQLEKVKLGWVNFQVMRRTYATMMRAADVDPKIVADMMGHNVDVNLNNYTQTPLDQRIEAAKRFETAFVH